MTQGSQAHLVLAQADAISTLISSIEETVGDELRTCRKVSDVNGVLLSNALIEGSSYVFLFGHSPEGFAIDHFRIIEGQGLAGARACGASPSSWDVVRRRA